MWIALTQGLYAEVDAEDYERLVALGPWVACKHDHTWYASTKVGGRKRYMHQEVLSARLVDHVDRDGLNNTRRNLRPASPTQNNWNQRKRADNTSGVKGVSWHKAAKKWMAYGNGYGKRTYLGLFTTLEAATSAVVCFRETTRGEFA